MSDRLGDRAAIREGIDGSDRAGVGKCGKGVVLPSNWIWFRYNPRNKDFVKNTILRLALGRLVDRLVLVLKIVSLDSWRETKTRERTQFLLKQS